MTKSKQRRVSILGHSGAESSLSAVAIKRRPFATGAGPPSVVFADLDGDGKRDVLTANSVGNSVSALLNRSGANCGAVQ